MNSEIEDLVNRREIVDHGIRWCSNILIELASNHGSILTAPQLEAMRNAIMTLGMCRDSLPAASSPATVETK